MTKNQSQDRNQKKRKTKIQKRQEFRKEWASGNHKLAWVWDPSKQSQIKTSS